MEGKAVLFKEFGGVDAWPICLATTDPDEIVRTVKAIAPGFGGINLEDISAPRCVEIEQRLRDELDIPVFHDDQHGTAIVVLAALLNALSVVGKRLEERRIVIIGAGAAARRSRARCSRPAPSSSSAATAPASSTRARGNEPGQAALGARDEPARPAGSATRRCAAPTSSSASSGPGAVSADAVRTMADGAIVFALANPRSRWPPEEIEGAVAVIGTGRSDYPNQINNVLVFPGVFRGALDVRARRSQGRWSWPLPARWPRWSSPSTSRRSTSIPSVFDRRVAPAVAEAVARGCRGGGGYAASPGSRTAGVGGSTSGSARSTPGSRHELRALKAEALVGQPREMRRCPARVLLRVE